MMLTPLRTLLAVSLALISISAQATTLSVDYFSIPSTDQDARSTPAGPIYNEVQSGLGSHLLPILNTTAFGCTVNCFSNASPPLDVLSTTGELSYWLTSSGGGPATAAGHDDITSNVFSLSPGGTANTFQATHVSATLTSDVAQSIDFSIQASDMAFAYLDHSLVCSLGGMHASMTAPCNGPLNIDPGTHSVDVFFAGINQLQSGLSFSISASDLQGPQPLGLDRSPIPDPDTLALILPGLIGLTAARSRRRRA